MLNGLIKSKTVTEMFELADKAAANGYNGLAANWIFADFNKGDIGYMVSASVPVRKDKTPYIACRVLDGTRTAFDWEPNKNIPLTELPRSFNPSKGYIVTANNRHWPENAKYDHGAQIMSTARQQRIVEMIENKIKNQQKMTAKDMSDMQ